MITQPISLGYGIRHLGPDDILAAVSISNVTRSIEAQNYILAEKLNELIVELKNSVQATPIVLPRVELGSMAAEWLGNFRIPVGYTATVVNASVASMPTSGSALLDIFHSPGTFGQNGSSQSATNVVSTTTEYTAVGDYVSAGELIFRVSNNTTLRIAATASITLAVKPVA